MHMPGHKGLAPLGPVGEANAIKAKAYEAAFAYDITEIKGADELFHAEGIIAESERNASKLFGCDTYYSTEGSSLCIRAMLYLCRVNARAATAAAKSNADAASATADSVASASANTTAYAPVASAEANATAHTPAAPRPWVLAARNVHQAFVTAAALLDLDVEWVYPTEACGANETGAQETDAGNAATEAVSLITMNIGGEEIRVALEEGVKLYGTLPCCVYVTSPDYTGHILPISEISKVCHEKKVPLVVDNAHGAYLKFLPESLHPIDLGADMCCDSAHKTLQVLTGGAYLHLKSEILSAKKEDVKRAMALFASTSPSWLILQSLDRQNELLASAFGAEIRESCETVCAMKKQLSEHGFGLWGEEPMKITILTRAWGYSGEEFAEELRHAERPVEVEFADKDMVVLMVAPCQSKAELEGVVEVIRKVPKRAVVNPAKATSGFVRPKRVMSIREAAMRPCETVPLEKAEGRVAHLMAASCPPAVPIVICGEKIEAEEISCLYDYGYNFCQVISD